MDTTERIIGREVAKFSDPLRTASGEARAHVDPRPLEVLWLNTGTLCNITCENCYIESSPRNDRLVYLSREDVRGYLQEIDAERWPLREIGITGGEPFMNPDILGILEDCLASGARVLVLTNAMRPMMKQAEGLRALRRRYPDTLVMRVSIDHYDPAKHEEERGPKSWAPAMRGLRWLAEEGFVLHIAGRTRWGDDETALRRGFARLFADMKLPVEAHDPQALVLFPEMDPTADVPEITDACWGILGVEPGRMMCANARMVVRRRGAAAAEVVSCTLLPYEDEFALGRTLRESLRPVSLNHAHCARFCVLGGASCSA